MYTITFAEDIMIAVKKLDYKFDIDILDQEASEIISKIGLNPQDNQICLQHSLWCENKWHDGTGSLPKKYQSKNLHQSADTSYTIINTDLKNTYIAQLIDAISIDYVVYRTRLMCLPSRSCYSWHYDQTYRLHVAIKTNAHCRMVFEDGSWHIPADGHVYFTDTTKWHSAFNGSIKEERVHLVACAVHK